MSYSSNSYLMNDRVACPGLPSSSAGNLWVPGMDGMPPMVNHNGIALPGFMQCMCPNGRSLGVYNTSECNYFVSHGVCGPQVLQHAV